MPRLDAFADRAAGPSGAVAIPPAPLKSSQNIGRRCWSLGVRPLELFPQPAAPFGMAAGAGKTLIAHFLAFVNAAFVFRGQDMRLG